jgi:WD repeat-containing protein 61
LDTPKRIIFRLLHYRDSIRSNEDETAEYLVTGSVDDAVKVWELKNGTLKVKHKLTGHSLGVVSVAVSSDGCSK